MSRRKPFACAAIAIGALTTVAASPATADARAPRNATLTAIGGMEFKVNRQVADTQRFNKDRVTIRSGGTLRLRDRTGQLHTFSLVKRSDLPRNFGQMEKCFEPGNACADIAAGHGFTSPESPPTNPLVQVGAAGFDVAGDSTLFGPRRGTSVKITAAKGRNLSYLCIIHPWMQGQVRVR